MRGVFPRGVARIALLGDDPAVPYAFPKTLWKLLLADLLRVLGVTLLSLVVLIAFAASIKPLADGKIALADMLVLMTLLIVPMLQFALPFAAGFATTLAYHRFAADNEASASMSAGISHARLVAPAGALGLIVAALLYALLTQIVPGFLREAEQLIRRDVTRALLAPINRGETVVIEQADLSVYAEHSVVAVPPRDLVEPGEARPVQRIQLFNVVAAGPIGVGGEPEFVVSADRIDLWIYEVPGESAMELQLEYFNASGRTEEGRLLTEEGHTRRIVIDGSFRDDPKFRTRTELNEALDNPRLIEPIDRAARELAFDLAQRAAIRTMADRLGSDEAVELERLGLGDRYRLFASGLSAIQDADPPAWRLEPTASTEPVRLLADRAGDADRLFTGVSGAIRLPPEPPSMAGRELPTPAFIVELSDVAVAEARAQDAASRVIRVGQPLSQADEHEEADLTIEGADQLAADLDALTLAELVERAKATDEPAIVRRAERLEEDVADQNREIRSKQQERIASSVAAGFIVLLSSLVAMRRPHLMPVPAYMFSFFPTLGSLIVIAAGQGLAHDVGTPGFALLWFGVAIPALGCVSEYVQLARH